jgi:predicted signal transduction protein with EAL and GGDEF domain
MTAIRCVNSSQRLKRVEQPTSIGVRIAVDDFETAFAVLAVHKGLAEEALGLEGRSLNQNRHGDFAKEGLLVHNSQN